MKALLLFLILLALVFGWMAPLIVIAVVLLSGFMLFLLACIVFGSLTTVEDAMIDNETIE